MLISGARVAVCSSEAVRRDLWIIDGLISFARIPEAEDLKLDLSGCLILPGLINAHDHLELNLFPKLGCGPYKNASAWAKDIYRPSEPPVKQHLAVRKPLRLLWGGIKNLLSGVTTVAHHNELDSTLLEPTFPVRVVKRYGWAHSVEFSPDWKARFDGTPADCPFVMHAAEGTDRTSGREVRTLEVSGALDDRSILVHGVGVRACDVHLLLRAKASLVWCPTSNQFTLQRTLAPSVLHSGIPIALGSDSAMTASGDLLDEIQVARKMVGAKRIYEMVTTEAARMFRLSIGFGGISDSGPADLLAMKDIGATPAETLLAGYPEVVIVRGTIQLSRRGSLNSMEKIEVEGRGTYWVAAPVSQLMEETKHELGETPKLAGKAVAV